MAQSSAGTVESNEVKELVPFGRNILVEPVEANLYRGTIILPDSTRDKLPVIGYVRAIGGKVEEEEMEGIAAGDKILYGRYSGVELRLDNSSRFLFLNVDDIIGKVVGYEGITDQS